MNKAFYILEILGLVSVLTCVLVMGCVNAHNDRAYTPAQVVITGTLG